MPIRPVQRAANAIPLLYCDLLQSVLRKRALKVFLCGQQLDTPFADTRRQLKWFLQHRFHVEAFLGEDIPELLAPTITSDHLTIETKAADRADLIVMFLGSPGTIAELTSFALNVGVRPKLLVFNDKKYQGQKTFLNLGPLKLVPAENVVWITPPIDKDLVLVLRSIDLAIARSVFGQHKASIVGTAVESFEQFLVLSSIYANYPISYEPLVRSVPLRPKLVDGALRELFAARMWKKADGLYWPAKPMEEVGLPNATVMEIGRLRVQSMSISLLDEEARARYRLCAG